MNTEEKNKIIDFLNNIDKKKLGDTIDGIVKITKNIDNLSSDAKLKRADLIQKKKALSDIALSNDQEFNGIIEEIYNKNSFAKSPKKCEEAGFDYNEFLGEYFKLIEEGKKYSPFNLNELEIDTASNDNIKYVIMDETFNKAKEEYTKILGEYNSILKEKNELEETRNDLNNNFTNFFKEGVNSVNISSEVNNISKLEETIDKVENAVNELKNSEEKEIEKSNDSVINVKENISKDADRPTENLDNTTHNLGIDSNLNLELNNTQNNIEKEIATFKFTKMSNIANSKKSKIDSIRNTFNKNKKVVDGKLVNTVSNGTNLNSSSVTEKNELNNSSNIISLGDLLKSDSEENNSMGLAA